MTSLIAFFIAITFGTANIAIDNPTSPAQEYTYSTDDGVGISGQGGQKTENPDPNRRG